MDIRNLKPGDAFDLSPQDAYELVESLDGFCDQINDEFNYFKKNGHPNPGDKTWQMVASMLMLTLDKLQAEGLFKSMPWREVYDEWLPDECFPDDFSDEAEQ